MKIAEIDKLIDQNHRHLAALEHINEMSAYSWERAWHKHPKLRERERELFIKRGEAQIHVH